MKSLSFEINGIFFTYRFLQFKANVIFVYVKINGAKNISQTSSDKNHHPCFASEQNNLKLKIMSVIVSKTNENDPLTLILFRVWHKHSKSYFIEIELLITLVNVRLGCQGSQD